MSRFFTRFVVFLVTIVGFSVLTQEASAQFSLRTYGAGFDVSPRAYTGAYGQVVAITPGYRVLTPGFGMRYGMGGLGVRNSIGMGRMGQKRINPYYRRHWK